MICFEWLEIVKIGLGIMNQFMDREIPHTQLSGMFHLASEHTLTNLLIKLKTTLKRRFLIKNGCLIDSNGK